MAAVPPPAGAPTVSTLDQVVKTTELKALLPESLQSVLAADAKFRTALQGNGHYSSLGDALNLIRLGAEAVNAYAEHTAYLDAAFEAQNAFQRTVISRMAEKQAKAHAEIERLAHQLALPPAPKDKV